MIYLFRSAIPFSKVVRTAVVAKTVILGISSLTSFVLAFREALTAKLVMSDILSGNLSMSNLYLSDFQLGKSVFLAKDDISTPLAFCYICFCCITRQI